jgi:hypothetical protein
MINIYLTFDKKSFKFFRDKNLFNKYNIKINSDFKDASIVFLLFNSGNNKLLNSKFKHLKNKEKYDQKNEIKAIEYFIQQKKKVIVYLRSDGSSIFSNINNLIQKYPKDILLLRDFILKDEKEYNTQANSHIKYIIYKNHDYSNLRETKELMNNLKNTLCFTIPFNKKFAYGFLGKKYEKKCLKKIYDVFYVKNYREGQLNCILRKKTLDKINNLKDKYKIFTESCIKEDYERKILESKIYISTWGLGESLRDDYFCLCNDTIVLKINTSCVKDFYCLFEEDNIFHFYKHDLSDLEEKIKLILDNYDYYYDLYNQKRKKLIKKYTKEYHVKFLSKNIEKYLIQK